MRRGREESCRRFCILGASDQSLITHCFFCHSGEEVEKEGDEEGRVVYLLAFTYMHWAGVLEERGSDVFLSTRAF